MIPNLYRGYPSTSIPFKFTYAYRLLVTFKGCMFPITLHVQLYTIMAIVLAILMVILLCTYLVTFRGHLLIITGTGYIALLFLEVPVLWHFPSSF